MVNFFELKRSFAMNKSILCHIGANLGRKNMVGKNSFPN